MLIFISRSGYFSLYWLTYRSYFPFGIFKGVRLMSSIHSTAQIGQKVRQTRQQLGLTQPQLALAVGVGIRFIVDLEAGKPTVRLDKVLQVLSGLGLVLRISDVTDPTATDV